MITAQLTSKDEKTPAVVFKNIDIPQDRTYTEDVDQQLDAALVEAIDAARTAGNDHLAQLIEYELGSHYLDNKA